MRRAAVTFWVRMMAQSSEYGVHSAGTGTSGNGWSWMGTAIGEHAPSDRAIHIRNDRTFTRGIVSADPRAALYPSVRGPATARRVIEYRAILDRAVLPRLRTWLARPDVVALDPDGVARLAAALDDADPPVAAGRAGSLVAYAPGRARRRLLQFDRRGHLVAACRWRDDGTLAWAKCLL